MARVSVNNANTDLDYFMASASEQQLLLAKCFSDFVLMLFPIEISQQRKACSRMLLSFDWTHAFHSIGIRRSLSSRRRSKLWLF